MAEILPYATPQTRPARNWRVWAGHVVLTWLALTLPVVTLLGSLSVYSSLENVYRRLQYDLPSGTEMTLAIGRFLERHRGWEFGSMIPLGIAALVHRRTARQAGTERPMTKTLLTLVVGLYVLLSVNILVMLAYFMPFITIGSTMARAPGR